MRKKVIFLLLNCLSFSFSSHAFIGRLQVLEKNKSTDKRFASYHDIHNFDPLLDQKQIEGIIGIFEDPRIGSSKLLLVEKSGPDVWQLDSIIASAHEQLCSTLEFYDNKQLVTFTAQDLIGSFKNNCKNKHELTFDQKTKLLLSALGEKSLTYNNFKRVDLARGFIVKWYNLLKYSLVSSLANNSGKELTQSQKATIDDMREKLTALDMPIDKFLNLFDNWATTIIHDAEIILNRISNKNNREMLSDFLRDIKSYQTEIQILRSRFAKSALDDMFLSAFLNLLIHDTAQNAKASPLMDIFRIIRKLLFVDKATLNLLPELETLKYILESDSKYVFYALGAHHSEQLSQILADEGYKVLFDSNLQLPDNTNKDSCYDITETEFTFDDIVPLPNEKLNYILADTDILENLCPQSN